MRQVDNKLIDELRHTHSPLVNEDDLDPLLEAIGERRIVMLGEASHGTHNYYTWRSKISKRLIEEKGFQLIAVEGDWPDCYEINRYIKGYENSGANELEVLHQYNRWPTWMWANWEIAELMNYLKTHNQEKPRNKRIGFYGLDVYSLWDSLKTILIYLKENDKSAYEMALHAWHCFEPYAGDEGYDYAKATQIVPYSCEKEVVDLLLKIREKKSDYNSNPEARLNTEQNALVTVNAEKYYRTMLRGGIESWNVRDRHMHETLERLADYYGEDSKMIVWEHNTHIGDARYTDMRNSGMVNIGQLARQSFSRDKVFLVGFGSYQGTVLAGDSWGAPVKRKKLPEARKDSWEAVCHDISAENKLFLSKNLDNIDALTHSIGHRAVGVIYHPSREEYGNYVPTIIPERYDAFLYIDRSEALYHLDTERMGSQMPDTYPWGL